MDRKQSFVLYADQLKHISRLSDEQAGRLFKAIYAFADTQETPVIDDPAVDMAFSFISEQIKRDAEKYNSVCEKRREAGKQGGAPKGNKNASKTSKSTNWSPKQANQPDTDTEPDTVPESDTVPDTDISSYSSNNDVSISTDYQSIVDLFNSTCLSLPKVQKLTDKRRKKIKALLKSYNEDDVKSVFAKAENSDFLKGSVNSFQATFDWLIESGNFIKVLEGNYDNRNKKQDTDMYYSNDLDDLF